MQLRTQAAVDLAAPRDAVFDHVTADRAMETLFVGYGPIPRVLRAEMVGGRAMGEGAVRRVHMSDGSAVDEEIREHARPQRHRYRLVSGIKPPLALLVKWAEGDWKFLPAAGGAATRIEWDYTFELTTPLVAPLALPVVHLFFRTAMERCLARVKAEVGG